MLFVLGCIAGVATCAFIAAVLLLLRTPIKDAVAPVVRAIERAAPSPKGFVFEPPDENDALREERIEENRKEGRDTPISELI